MLFTSECFLSLFVEKYTLFTFVLFVFFKSKHDISLSIIKRQDNRQDLKRLNTNKNIFIVMVITTGQEENKLCGKFNLRA